MIIVLLRLQLYLQFKRNCHKLHCGMYLHRVIFVSLFESRHNHENTHACIKYKEIKFCVRIRILIVYFDGCCHLVFVLIVFWLFVFMFCHHYNCAACVFTVFVDFGLKIWLLYECVPIPLLY